MNPKLKLKHNLNVQNEDYLKKCLHHSTTDTAALMLNVQLLTIKTQLKSNFVNKKSKTLNIFINN